MTTKPKGPSPAARHWSVPMALAVLLVATTLIAWMSEILVGWVEHVIAQVGISEFFLGVIIMPIIGNVAEHLVAVQVARKNQMELSLAISVGSSLQIALVRRAVARLCQPADGQSP